MRTPIEFRLGIELLGVRHDPGKGRLRLLLRLDADDDAARIGFVENLRGDDLHHHRETRSRRRSWAASFSFFDELRGQRVEAVAFEEFQPVQFAQAVSYRRPDIPDDLLRTRIVMRLKLEGRQVLAVLPTGKLVERPQRLGCVLGELVDRIAVLLEVRHAGRDIDDPHEAAKDRFG